MKLINLFRGSMVLTAILLVALLAVMFGCSSPPLAPEPDPELTIWFNDTISLAYYSADPELFIALQGHAEVKPPAPIEWCLDVLGGESYCNVNTSGERAGQRIYLLRDLPWQVRMRAWTEDLQGSKLWEWEAEG